MASKKNGVAGVASLRYWRAEDARVVVEAWKESGEGLTAFARRHGIKPRRLSQWATRFLLSGNMLVDARILNEGDMRASTDRSKGMLDSIRLGRIGTTFCL